MATILYIDPNPAAQPIIQAALGHTHNVVTVTDGSAAIQYCAMIQPNLVLLDTALTDIDVSELSLRLKMFMPQTPILVFGQSGGVEQPVVAGADGYLSKSISPDDLRERLRPLLPKPASLPQISAKETLEQFENQILALNQANQRLASLNAISALIGTSLDLEHLTDEVLQQIQKTVNFDSATLFLLKGNILEAAASRGLLEYRRGLNVFPKNRQNSAWRVVINKLPLIINDVTQSDYWEARPELSRVRSWLGVPLIFKDRVVGVLTLDNNVRHAFTDADARFVFTLAFQIAIAVENAQLFQEWENQATRLKLINEVNQEITTLLDTGKLYDTLAQALVERLGYDRVAIFEMAPFRDMLLLRAYHTGGQPSIEPLDPGDYRYPVDAGLIGRAIQTGQPMIAGDVDDPEQALTGMAVKSALVVPIFVDNKIEAVMSIDSLQSHRFGDQDLWTVSSVATQAATVIENARLYHSIDTYSAMLEKTVLARTQRLQAIKQISQVISHGFSVDELLTMLGQEISHIFSTTEGQAVQVATGLINGPQLVIRVIFDASHPTDRNRLVDETRKLNSTSAVGQVIRQSQPTILNNVSLDKIYAAVLSAKARASNALMIAPLITAGKTIGVIMVKSDNYAVFDEDDLETLESVAFQVASAIEYARLLRKTKDMAIVEERTRLARDMHDGVAQNLAYLLIQVDRCLAMVDEGSRVEQQLETIGLLLEHNIDELRRNIFDLRPLEFEDKTLLEVLENVVTEFGRRWNLQVSCSVRGQVEAIPAEVESSLYRIVQEGLSNARQHAHCRRVSVDVTVNEDGWLVLCIEDDGRGFAPDGRQTEASGHGLGLVSMRERAESVRGSLTIESSPEAGTRIVAQLPLTSSREKGVF